MPKKHPILQAIDNIAPEPVPKLARKLRAKPAAVQPEDPIAELRHLVRQHRLLMRCAVQFGNAVGDKKNRETGEAIPSVCPAKVQVEVQAMVKQINHEALSLKRQMGRLLRGVPIYDEFLKYVPGIKEGTVSAYIVTMVRFDRCDTVSQLLRYCGQATDSRLMVGSEKNKQYGRMERRHAAPKYAPDGTRTEGGGTYNAELRTALYLGFTGGLWNNMSRMAMRREDHKYMRRWDEAMHSALTLPNARLGRVMTEAEARTKGRNKAIDLFVWDLYVMGRTLAGLPIRPDKYSAVRGRYHNGQEARDAMYHLTLDEARSMVFPIVSIAVDKAAE